MQSTDVRLRAADSDDRDAVFNLFAEVQSIHAAAEPDFFRQPVNDDRFDAFFRGVLDNPQHHLVLACIGGKPIAYVQFFIGTRAESLYQPERRLARINQLAVAEGHRRTGCGTKLIEHVKDQARAQGISLLGIDYWSFNAASRACFRKNGFHVRQEFMWLRL